MAFVIHDICVAFIRFRLEYEEDMGLFELFHSELQMFFLKKESKLKKCFKMLRGGSLMQNN